MSKWRERALDGLTIFVALVAITTAGAATYQRSHRPAMIASGVDREVDDWASLRAEGRQVGAQTPILTLVEFGDYECPACREYHRALKGAMSAYPDDIRLVYRHWPLPMHRGAYAAARAAECAAAQDQFARFHERLYEDEAWMTNARESFLHYADEVQIGNRAAFAKCIDDVDSLATIARDVAVVRELGGRGTPTLVLNGTLVAVPPDSAMLAEKVRVLRRH